MTDMLRPGLGIATVPLRHQLAQGWYHGPFGAVWVFRGCPVGCRGSPQKQEG